MYIDIGGRWKIRGRKISIYWRLCIFDSQYIEFGDNLVKAKA